MYLLSQINKFKGNDDWKKKIKMKIKNSIKVHNKI
jgi:hypothetical protein